MNATVHSELSLKRWGGNDLGIFYKIHDFVDSSKEVEPSNRHRFFLHNMWAVKRVIIPIFGHTIYTSEGKAVNVKDLMEFDHLLPDFRGKFIPTLSDYVDLIEPRENDEEVLRKFKDENAYLFDDGEISDLMFSPLANTGKITSLYLTHNSWFVLEILPKIFQSFDFKITNFSIAPKDIFNRMPYVSWMNGDGTPPSMVKIPKNEKPEKSFIPFDLPKSTPSVDIVYDGSKRPRNDQLID